MYEKKIETLHKTFKEIRKRHEEHSFPLLYFRTSSTAELPCIGPNRERFSSPSWNQDASSIRKTLGVRRVSEGKPEKLVSVKCPIGAHILLCGCDRHTLNKEAEVIGIPSAGLAFLRSY